jgi:DNA-binding beta-propeller fold protein YncE
MTPARLSQRTQRTQRTHHAVRSFLVAAALATAAAASAPAAAAPAFTAFESGHVRPLALSSNGKLLFAVNTPDNRLEIFRVKDNSLRHRSSVPVGIEPVAVAVRSDTEVWVVNHLSDSVSVVKLDPDGRDGRVVRTLLVGDEPRDIVFAGGHNHGRKRAFITAAHRGQNAPFDPALTTPSQGRADVWVFDAEQLGNSLTGDPLTILSLFSDTPRALAVSPNGERVYAAAFHSGNRTTTVSFVFGPELPGPQENFQGVPAPANGLIVKWNGQHWVDELGHAHDDNVNFSLPDKDVFTIDATASVPKQVQGPGGVYTGVGTVLFNMAVNPVSGKVYVANTEARNEERFEGGGVFAGHSVRGHFVESRITVLGKTGSVAPRHLNKHINYASCCAPTPNAESEKSLALPQGMAVTADGSKLYVAALGSSKIGVYNTAALENDSFVPNKNDQITVSGGGPTGVVLDDHKSRLFVLTRFDNSISIVNTKTRLETAHVAMHNPEPESLVNGRKFLYDATLSSSHGDSSCAGCHVYGDLDSLAWDLGDPDGEVMADPGPFIGPLFDPVSGQPVAPVFHPMKGPMTTQSLRGMANHGPMHWRGDRTGGNDASTAQPDSGTFDERAGFKKFQAAFAGLLGRSAPLGDAEMAAFTDFILQVTYPPNPIRALDNSLSPEEQAGRDIYMSRHLLLGSLRCVDCHALDPHANPGADLPGFFGSSGLSAFVFEPNLLKVPHLRNMYQKVGMFGFVGIPGVPGDPGFMGDQVRGFGFTHDGGADTLFRFHSSPFFAQSPDNPEGFPNSPEGIVEREQVSAFLLAYDSNLAPIVGQQVTLTSCNSAAAGPRINLLLARANAGECDLVAKSFYDDRERGYLYVGSGQFIGDRQGAPARSDAYLRQLATQHAHEVTYTCTPPGSGARLAVDRDSDGFLDGDELAAGSNPADPSSTP